MIKRLLYTGYILLLLYIVWFVGSKPEQTVMINLIPFHTIRLYISALIHGYAPLHIIFQNVIGNILLTVPIGILICDYFRLVKWWTLLFFSFYIPAYIEAIQLLIHITGYGTRTVDIDDVLLNALGIWIGFFSTLLWKNKRTK